MRFLVTGGCGFAGSHLVGELLSQGHQVTVMDNLTYAGLLRNLAHLSGFKLVHHDFSQSLKPESTLFDYVIHNGAESHVLRSLEAPGKFVQSNVIGTLNLLEWARQHGCIKKFVYVSTDEVFGPAGDESYHEGDRLCPTNPYSATKAAGEFLVRAYFRSFGLPALITRTGNMFGERQHYEKFVPKIIGQVLGGETVDIHCQSHYKGGPPDDICNRMWLYVGEQAKALVWLAEYGEPGKAYHVSEGTSKCVLTMASTIAGILGRDLTYRLVCVDGDLGYKISTKGTPEHKNWDLTNQFEALFVKTVLWYRDHSEFLS